jgi:hypothetical protein
MEGQDRTIPDTLRVSLAAPVAAAPSPVPAAPARSHVMSQGLLQRRALWLIGALLVAGAGWFGYHWIFGKAAVLYTTATVQRGDVEHGGGGRRRPTRQLC